MKTLNSEELTNEYNIEYPTAYPKLNETQAKSIVRHCNKYVVPKEICAYYSDMQDFFSDWCDDLGYSRTEARALLYCGKGEFKTFKGFGIIRFAL